MRPPLSTDRSVRRRHQILGPRESALNLRAYIDKVSRTCPLSGRSEEEEASDEGESVSEQILLFSHRPTEGLLSPWTHRLISRYPVHSERETRNLSSVSPPQRIRKTRGSLARLAPSTQASETSSRIYLFTQVCL
jgi:hypothetical protein